jgi:hypothetical protein
MNYAEQWEMPLDRGISYAVKVLRDAGLETYESCDGGAGHAFKEPTVRFHGNQAEGFVAVAQALKNGLPVSDLRRFWMVVDGELDGPYWEMTFGPREALLAMQDKAESGGLLD